MASLLKNFVASVLPIKLETCFLQNTNHFAVPQ
jgi:hypothetical protein